MKIAVVHDYFTQLGGAEKVAEELMRLMPDASLHSTVAVLECMPPGLADLRVETTWMQYLPNMKRLYRYYFPLYPLAIRSLELSRYDLVVSSSSGYAKGVRTNPHAIHVCYCHTPMRWAWNFDTYAENSMGNTGRLLLPSIISALREWDLDASRQPDHFIANSHTVAERIRRIYGRNAEVIHPPIDTHRFQPAEEQGDYYLILSRLVSYKRIDVAIEACTKLARKLIVIGDGPDRQRLEKMAGPTVQFVGRLSDKEVEYYASRCKSLIFPGEEDFGMAPLELAAAGRPTIAYRAGGARESIIDGLTGIFFDVQDADHLADAIEEFERSEWSPELLRDHARNYSVEVFQSKLRNFLARVGAQIPETCVLSQSKRPAALKGLVPELEAEGLSA